MALLTKSKYLNGLQCPKLLWITFNKPELLPEIDTSTQFKFNEGHKVGELATILYKEGISIPTDEFMGNIRKTKELLEKRTTLFEPGFMTENLFARADILEPVEDNQWDIIEVKMGTAVKEVNIHDVSFQRYVYEKAGLKIRKCFLMHINNQYVKKGEIDPEGLFTKEDITEQLISKEDISKFITEMFNIIKSDEMPDIQINKNCTSPYECPLFSNCWGFLPENNVFNLYRGGKKSFELFENSTLAIKDIPDNFKLNAKQEIQKQCELLGTPHINKEAIKAFLDTLEYPLYYLDFETFGPVIPLFDGMRPYQKIPFQFSLHIVEEDGTITHKSFLGNADNPRKEFLDKLKEYLGNKGSIIVYNQVFEKGVLLELAHDFPEYEEWKDAIINRFIDLLIPFRNFDYYNPTQQGSASIKKVLPAITGKDYSHLEIDNGILASISFAEVAYGSASEEERIKVRENLEKYCTLDTEGMIWIIDKLRKILN